MLGKIATGTPCVPLEGLDIFLDPQKDLSSYFYIRVTRRHQVLFLVIFNLPKPFYTLYNKTKYLVSTK